MGCLGSRARPVSFYVPLQQLGVAWHGMAWRGVWLLWAVVAVVAVMAALDSITSKDK